VAFAGGAPAANSTIEIRSGTSTFFSFGGTTNASGQATIANVIGAFSLRARHPTAFVPGPSVTGTITAEGQVVPVTLGLPAVGSVQVQVNSTDGVPVSGAEVRYRDAFGDSFFNFGGLTDANGRATILRVRTSFTVQAMEFSNPSFRRFASGEITTEGELAQVTITLGTRGSVTGQVTSEEGSPMGGLQVSIISEFSEQIATTTSDSGGRYTFQDVPTGRFRVRVPDPSNLRAGSFSGELAAHGDEAVADVIVNQVLMTDGVILTDVNGRNYAVSANGNLGPFSPSVFEAFRQSHQLLVGPSPALTGFTGDFAASTSLAGRQLAIANTTRADGGFPAPIAGITVSRRVYVPSSGDFLRYLDVLENTTAASITVGVRIQAALAAGFGTRLLATSDGDAVVTKDDRWVTADDQFQPQRAVAAVIFQGAESAYPADLAGTGFQPDRPFAEWTNVTIPAGGRAILMHFAVQQLDSASAIATAERLALAPSEAIADLSAEDRAAIVNFAVPPPIAMAPGAAGGAGTDTGASTGANLRIPD
jgi:hypothetical protein